VILTTVSTGSRWTFPGRYLSFVNFLMFVVRGVFDFAFTSEITQGARATVWKIIKKLPENVFSRYLFMEVINARQKDYLTFCGPVTNFRHNDTASRYCLAEAIMCRIVFLQTRLCKNVCTLSAGCSMPSPSYKGSLRPKGVHVVEMECIFTDCTTTTNDDCDRDVIAVLTVNDDCEWCLWCC
jgi:hypothetical protein